MAVNGPNSFNESLTCSGNSRHHDRKRSQPVLVDKARLWSEQKGFQIPSRESDYYRRVTTRVRPFIGIGAALVAVLLLSSCGAPTGDARPSNSNLIAGINLLVSNFDSHHPELVTWKIAAVKVQLTQRLPTGRNTEAGWFIEWPAPKDGELSQVVVPWTLLGQYPNNPLPYFHHYKGGGLVPQATSVDLVKNIIAAEMQGDQYFGAVVGIRSSKINPQWIIFTTVPYLPVTDPAYGFATVKNKSWSVVDFGTALVGCGTVPINVESEFGYRCP